jgi:hypothetical protein
MAKFRSHLLMHIFRILTPEEINEIASISTGEQRVSLTELMEGHAVELEIVHEAKVLPFKRGGEGERSEEDDQGKNVEGQSLVNLKCGDNVADYFEFLIEEKNRLAKSVLGEKKWAKSTRDITQKETSTFIMENKKKLEESYGKMKKIEVLSLYRQTAKVTIMKNTSRSSDSPKKTSQTGILINKKQA